MNKNANNRRAGTGKVSWLGGLMHYKECSYYMETRQNGSGTYNVRCSGRSKRGHDTCGNSKYHRISNLEALVEKELIRHINNYEISAPIEVPRNNIDIEIALVEIAKKIDNITTAIAEGGIISSLTKKLQTLEDEKKQLVDKLVPPTASIDISLKAAFDSFLNNWNSRDVQEKSKIVQSIISDITFDKNKVIEINYMQ